MKNNTTYSDLSGKQVVQLIPKNLHYFIYISIEIQFIYNLFDYHPF